VLSFDSLVVALTVMRPLKGRRPVMASRLRPARSGRIERSRRNDLRERALTVKWRIVRAPTTDLTCTDGPELALYHRDQEENHWQGSNASTPSIAAEYAQFP
jgi:hypothetical protein